MKLTKRPTKTQLRKIFDYNEQTGRLIYKSREGNTKFNARFEGKSAGFIDNGRVRVSLGGKLFYNSVLVFIYHNGAVPKGYQVDHINRNTLDDRLKNLRKVTASQNCFNRESRGTVSFKGVSKIATNKFRARITRYGKVKSLGVFPTAHEAALAYDEACKRLHGKFGLLNFA